MESVHRAVSVCFGFAFAAFIGLVFLVSQCTIREKEIRKDTELAEQSIRMECVKQGGEWTSITDYADGYKSCQKRH